MGIVFSGMFAIGLVMFTKIQTEQHLTHILFGNVLGVSHQELIQSAVISAIIFCMIVFKRKDFLLYCFDPSHARVAGLSPKILHYGLLMLLALTIVSTMQVVGVILVVAMFNCARNYRTYAHKILLIKCYGLPIVSSITSSLIGVILSYHLMRQLVLVLFYYKRYFFIGALFLSRIKQKTY